MEKKLAESLKYIGSRILGSYDFDASLIGLILRKIFYKKEFIKKRNIALQETTSTIEKKIYFKLRNAFAGNKIEIESLLTDFESSLDKIISTYCQKDKINFWINRDYYYPWLDQAILRIKWFFLAKSKTDPTSYHHHQILGLVQKTVIAHKRIIKESVPWWNALYLWIFPPSEFKLIDKMIDFSNQTTFLSGIDQKIATMMHLNLFLLIFNFYKKRILEDYEPDFIDDIDFMIESIQSIYTELEIPEDIKTQYQERVEKDIVINLTMSWEDLKPKLIQHASTAQNQYELLNKPSKSKIPSFKKTVDKENKETGLDSFLKVFIGLSAFKGNSKK